MKLNNHSDATSDLMPVVYIPHGGGPMPLLGDPGHKDLIEFLVGLPDQVAEATATAKPTAILMISAHWESDIVRVSSSATPEMIYDYGGFPQETYEYHYPAPGNPELANTVIDLLVDSHIDCCLDSHRGYDHGTFVPLMLMYPKAEIPVVQVSLLCSLDPESHIALGRALAPLREQGVLIVGSGLSSHNIGVTKEKSQAFDRWLTEVITTEPADETSEKLTNWSLAPSARDCHPREDHLLPLHVCFGAAFQSENPADKVFSCTLYNNRVSAFMWR